MITMSISEKDVVSVLPPAYIRMCGEAMPAGLAACVVRDLLEARGARASYAMVYAKLRRLTREGKIRRWGLRPWYSRLKGEDV